jgi:hypothetical protein
VPSVNHYQFCKFFIEAPNHQPESKITMPYVTVGKENGANIDIYYKDWGKGQPIVFSHGWPLSGDDWDAQMLFFLQHGYRVIAHDRRGHGRSTQTSEDPVPVARPNRLNPFRELADGGPHSFQESPSRVCQQHASAAAPKERHSQMFLQALDALAHRAMGHVHLLRGMREIQSSGSRLEEAKRLERGKYARHAEMIPAPTAGAEPLKPSAVIPGTRCLLWGAANTAKKQT